MAITTLEEIIEVNKEEIPEELKRLDKWVLWRAEWNNKKEDYKKVPYATEGNKASSTNSDTWNSFDNVIDILENDNSFSGIGYVLNTDDDYICLDIDDAVDTNTGQLTSDLALEMINLTYCEYSPSGTGLHCFFKGQLTEERKKKRTDLNIELYDRSRFMTFTGHSIGQSEICDEQEVINNLLNRYFKLEESKEHIIQLDYSQQNTDLSDEEVINIMMKSKQQDKLAELLKGNYNEYFDSPSEAVKSLLQYLAFYTGRNKEQMERIFLNYNNLTDKWDSKRGSTTWGDLELDKAITDCHSVYDPKYNDTSNYSIQIDEELIPEPYKLGENGWLYKMIEKGKGDDKQIVPKLITSTPPLITKQFKDIESSNISYELSYRKDNQTSNIPVQALDIADTKNIINLSSKGLDVDTINRLEVVNFISMFKRINDLKTEKTVSRLGHVKSHFIHPLIENDVELIIHEEGYKNLANSFKTKGTLKDYSDTVFNEVKNSPMAMMFMYASLGSILLHDFGVEPFIVDMASKTSTGKTTALKVAASVWGTNDLVSEWNTTKVNVERKASLMNSFPLIYDDSRKAPVYQLADIVYQFSGGRSKGRGNIHSIDVEKTWQNILISTGETSIVEYGNEKAGIGARVITLQDEPFTDDVSFTNIYDGLSSNYGHLGLAFIKQYQVKKKDYYKAFRGHEQLFIGKAETNEVMQRLGRAFAVLQTAAEILNDIEYFEHDPFKMVNEAYESMKENNKSIDKPKQLLVEVLEYMQANRNSIIGEGYAELYTGEIKGIYKNTMLGIQNETLKSILGYELTTIVKEWNNRNYLMNNGKRLQKQIKHKGKQYMVYAINENIIKELGFDFNQSHYHYYEE